MWCAKGDVVYYNAKLRKTVRYLPGVQPSLSHATKTHHNPFTSGSAAQVVAPDSRAEHEAFVPIDFATAMSIEGHESQVVHVGHAVRPHSLWFCIDRYCVWANRSIWSRSNAFALKQAP